MHHSLRTAAAVLDVVLASAPVPFALFDPELRYIHVNERFAAVNGVPVAAHLGRTLAEVVPEVAAAVEPLLRRILETGEPMVNVEVDGQLMGRPAETRRWLASAYPVRGQDGTILGVAILCPEITAQRRAEEALRESEARYTHIAANVPAMVYQFVYRPDGTWGYTYVSEGARTLFGVAPEDAVRDSATLLDLIHPDDFPQCQARSREAAATLSPFRWEGRVVLRSGEERFIHVAGRNERLPDGGVATDGLIMDITELRETARLLEESEQRYRSLFDHHPDAVYSLDLDGRFLSVNPACTAVAGYAPEELLGQSFAPLVVPEDLDRVTATFRANVGGASTHIEFAIRHRAGHRVQLAVTGMPIIVGGQLVGVFGIAKDLTAQRELEAQLRQAQKMEALGQLAGGVAHDFNNLLTAIKVHAALALEESALPDAAVNDLHEIHKAADRSAALTRQLLAFSRKQLLQPRVLDLNAIVRGLEPMLRRLIGEDIGVRTRLASGLGLVRADPGQLEQVLMNLVVNVRDAMPSGGTLTVTTDNLEVPARAAEHPVAAAPGSYVMLSVTDTGCGMSAEVRARIFEPFFTTKPAGKGTGLGLSTVYGIVQQSGGHITVESAPDQGATFAIYLPRASETVAASPASPAAAERLHGSETVLLVEDEQAVRSLVRRILERKGYAVLEARDGREGLAIAGTYEGCIDLVLTDMVMPGMSGCALVAQLTAARPSLRVLYTSGYTDDEIVRRGLLADGVSFLPKPFTADELARAVRRALEGGAPLRV